jgi:nitrilase
MSDKILAAAVQASPVFPLNKDVSIEKVCALIESAAKQGAQLIVFPEAFVPAYPNWSIDLETPDEWAKNLVQITREAVEVPGVEINRVAAKAREYGVYVILGVNEKVNPYQGMLYSTVVFIGADGTLLGRHRKLLPSNRENAFWHRGDGIDLKAVHETDIGRIGGYVGYEHLQPLFKYALMAQGEQIHCALWSGWSGLPVGRAENQVIDAAIRSYALEGQCFVVCSAMYVSPLYGELAGFGNAAWTFFGGSGIINPSGEYIAGPLYHQEGILYAELDLEQIVLRKAIIDTTGRDSRWDVVNINMAVTTEYAPFNLGIPAPNLGQTAPLPAPRIIAETPSEIPLLEESGVRKQGSEVEETEQGD